MIKVSFVYNNYSVEIEGETASDVEMDIVETKAMLHQMPAAVRPVPPVSSGSDAGSSVPVSSGNASDERADQEIIPVASIEKTTLRRGEIAYKVRGGKYDTFGVMLYPDTCIFKDGLVASLIMNDVVAGLEAKIIRQDGKLRVAALRRKQASV